MKVSPEQLREFAPAAEKFHSGIVQAIDRFSINKPNRFHYWIANCAFESNGFATLIENLNYSKPETLVRVFRRQFDRDQDKTISPAELAFAKSLCGKPEALANYVYAGRMGNGPEASGDGWRHRGAGAIQLTGSDNHKAYSLAVYGDLRVWADPTMLVRDPDAVLSAGWFAERNRLNAVADAGNFAGYCGLISTGSIHGTAHGLDDGDRSDVDSREDWRLRAVRIFS